MNDLSANARISVRDVATRYGVSLRTVARWIADEVLEFPRPIYIRGRRYIKVGDLRAWEAIQPDQLGRQQNSQTF